MKQYRKILPNLGNNFNCLISGWIDREENSSFFTYKLLVTLRPWCFQPRPKVGAFLTLSDPWGSFLPYPWVNWLLMFFGWVFQFQNLMVFQVEGTYIAYWTQKVWFLVNFLDTCIFLKFCYKNGLLKANILQKLLPSPEFDPWSSAWQARALPLYYEAMEEATMIRFYCYCEWVWQKGHPLGLKRMKYTFGPIVLVQVEIWFLMMVVLTFKLGKMCVSKKGLQTKVISLGKWF